MEYGGYMAIILANGNISAPAWYFAVMLRQA